MTPDVLLKTGQQVMTYLPLSEAIEDKRVQDRKCGVVVLQYVTPKKAGKHIVRV